MRTLTMVGMFLLAMASLAGGQTTTPLVTPTGPPQQQLQQHREMMPGQMQMLKQQDMRQRRHFKKLEDPSNQQFKCKYDSKWDEFRCTRRRPIVNK